MFENGITEWSLPDKIETPTAHGHCVFAKPLDNIKVEVIGGTSVNPETKKDRRDVTAKIDQNDDNPNQYDITLRTHHDRKGEFSLKVLTEFGGKEYSWTSPTIFYDVTEQSE